VVGVDGSPAADTALHLALEEAAARRAGIVAVRVYPVQTQYWAPEMPAEDPVRRREHELRFLTEDIEAWGEKYPNVPVERVVHEGHPAEVLADLSASAQLIVVGTRGHGGFTGLLLGSVSLQVLHHAQCPVLVAHQQPTTAQ
jgi:nucleotide-binding universal stress UspA family protein